MAFPKESNDKHDYIDEYDEGRWSIGQTLREWRHSPCLMSPFCALLLLIFIAVSITTFMVRIPAVLIGFIISIPIQKRGNWFVEFLYPSAIAKWGHLLIARYSMKGNVIGKHHSRAIEQRVEVLKRRVYIHSIPVLLDNICYLIVCPPHRNEPSNVPALGIVVDCGDAATLLEAMRMIQDEHYHGRVIRIVAILSTHKHHDHTAGNRDLVKHQEEFGFQVKVFAGAVERVPMCTDPVQNGDILEIPTIGDNINRYIQIEAISTPSHTRGSMVYRLYTLNPNRSDSSPVNYLFTGDAMFSAGGGVPFEADLDFGKETTANIDNRKSHQCVHPSKGSYSTERCFAEILVRCSSSTNNGIPNVVIHPGHEYTSELLQRQFTPTKGINFEWYKLPPSTFFEVASQYFIAQHRRTLPKGARLLTVPTCLSRELIINPHFRNLRKQGNFLVSAVRVWYKHLSRRKLSDADYNPRSSVKSTKKSRKRVDKHENGKRIFRKSESTMNTWNVSHDEISRSVFTTIYSSDLESVISELRSNAITRKSAADRLSKLSSKMDVPQTTRRPIPNTLPTEKSIWLGTLALTLLGSPPCGMTRSDAMRMNLPPPKRHSDRIKISRQRILTVLLRLGCLESIECENARLLTLLWKEASADDLTLLDENDNNVGYESTELENGHIDNIPDEIELGYLKHELYGASMNQPSKFLSCVPCVSNGKKTQQYSGDYLGNSLRERNLKNMKRTNGELLRHDIEFCMMCKNSVGCPILEAESEKERVESEKKLGFLEAEERSLSGVESMVLDAASVASSQISCFKEDVTSGEDLEVVIVNGLGR